MELRWLKNLGNLPYVLFVLLLVFVATILALGEVIPEKMARFYSWGFNDPSRS